MSKLHRSITPAPIVGEEPPETTVVGGTFTVYVLDDALRRRYTAEAQAIPSEDVEQAPSHYHAHLLHMSTVQATAVRDLDMLVKVPVKGELITRDEVHGFSGLLVFASDAGIAWDNANVTRHIQPETAGAAKGASPDAMSLQALRVEVKKQRRVILRAFELRFCDDREGQRIVREVRAGRGDGDLARDNRRVLQMCDDARHKAWIESLPKGEGKAVARLREIAPAFAQKVATVDAPKPDLRALKAQRDRAWTLVSRAFERIRLAGSYLVDGDPARASDYNAYERPSKRKKRG